MCALVTTRSPVKMAKPIEMPFGAKNRVGPKNHVLHQGLDPPWESTLLGAIKPTKKHCNS